MPNPDLVIVRPPTGTLRRPALEGYRQRPNSHDESVNEMNMTHPEACIRQKRRRTVPHYTEIWRVSRIGDRFGADLRKPPARRFRSRIERQRLPEVAGGGGCVRGRQFQKAEVRID